jgi:hypothetical protein
MPGAQRWPEFSARVRIDAQGLSRLAIRAILIKEDLQEKRESY